jgi:hemolysin III
VRPSRVERWRLRAYPPLMARPAPSPASPAPGRLDGRHDYPAYALSERIADGIVHGIGVAAAIAGAAILLVLADARLDAREATAIAIYGGALVAAFVASACYHMTPWERLRPWLRRLDHASIYLLIAGTYTPLTLAIGGPLALAVLAAVWVIAIGGALAKMLFWQAPGRLGLALYLALGWLSLILAWPMVAALPVAASVLVGIGGLLYTGGVVFFAWDGLKFGNAIWHAFVLAASGCFYAAIAVGVALA